MTRSRHDRPTGEMGYRGREAKKGKRAFAKAKAGEGETAGEASDTCGGGSNSCRCYC